MHKKVNMDDNLITDDSLYIFGAGASKAEGAPLQAEFLKLFFEKKDVSGDFNKKFPNVRDFLKDLFKISDGNGSYFPTFEEIYGILSISNERNEYFIKAGDIAFHDLTKNINSVPVLGTKIANGQFEIPKSKLKKIGHYGGLQEYRYKYSNLEKEITLFLGYALKELLKKKKPIYHRRLLKKINLDKSLFLNLNYDVLLDNVLHRKLAKQNKEINYHLPFEKLNNNNNKGVSLFKLHGSLNWGVCPYCKKLYVNFDEYSDLTNRHSHGKFDFTKINKSRECEECNTPLNPIIIPPSYIKNFNNYYLHRLWFEFDQTLQKKKIKNVIICGYSFPDADIHIKYLLKRLELLNDSFENIFIVNGSQAENNETSFDLLHQRLRRFFSNKIMIYDTYSNFQAFSKDPNKCLKNALEKPIN